MLSDQIEGDEVADPLVKLGRALEIVNRKVRLVILRR